MKSKLTTLAILCSVFPFMLGLWGALRVAMEMRGIRAVERIEQVNCFFELMATVYGMFLLMGYVAAGVLLIKDRYRCGNRSSHNREMFKPNTSRGDLEE